MGIFEEGNFRAWLHMVRGEAFKGGLCSTKKQEEWKVYEHGQIPKLELKK